MAKYRQIPCTNCNGTGKFKPTLWVNLDGQKCDVTLWCQVCGGSGYRLQKVKKSAAWSPV